MPDGVRTDAVWLSSPGHNAAHAYAPGAQPGDLALCGRNAHLGARPRPAGEGMHRCYVCLRAVGLDPAHVGRSAPALAAVPDAPPVDLGFEGIDGRQRDLLIGLCESHVIHLRAAIASLRSMQSNPSPFERELSLTERTLRSLKALS